MVSIPRISKLWRRMLEREPRPLILIYHRVAELTSDPQLLSVTPERFQEHLDVLRKRFRPMRLPRFLSALEGRSCPHRAVVVTFDDGYADNLENAKPVLKRYDIPGTVFVTTGHLEGKREFWWDELERLLLRPGRLPGTLSLQVNGTVREWDLGEAQNYGHDEWTNNSRWNVRDEGDPTPRHAIYRSLFPLLRPLPAREQWKILDAIVELARAGQESRPTHRVLSDADLAELASGDLVEIGAHTVSHPVLSSLSLSEQESEIRRGKRRLEDILGRPVTSFSYPYGGASDFTPETVSAVREAGFACACTTSVGYVRTGTDRYHLPRVVVRDWDGDEFTMRVERWIGR